MSVGKYNDGIAIALAWPQTFCKEPGSWYDPVTRWLGINRNNYYRAGHAALVLVNRNDQKCRYFDFGRYHAPYRHGRVRSADTDHDLEMISTAHISTNGSKILNLREILEELQNNPACHGEGTLHASYCKIDFESAHQKALNMQAESPLAYGPFISEGSNCSRFVNTVILSGRPAWKYRFRLQYFIPLTPTPMNNVNSLPNKMLIPPLRESQPYIPLRPLSKSELVSTLPRPEKTPNIPESAQWLSGEGAGSWFMIELKKGLLKVTRYAPDGTIECSGYYKGSVNGQSVDPGSYKIDYPSNCREMNLRHKDRNTRFLRILE